MDIAEMTVDPLRQMCCEIAELEAISEKLVGMSEAILRRAANTAAGVARFPGPSMPRESESPALRDQFGSADSADETDADRATWVEPDRNGFKASDRKSFASLAVLLEEASWQRNHIWKFPFHKDPEDTNERERDWVRMEFECRRRIDAIMNQWVANRESPSEISPSDDYFRYLRFEAAARFLQQFPTRESSPFVFPDMSTEAFLRWILIDWWGAEGVFQALHYVCESNFRAEISLN